MILYVLVNKYLHNHKMSRLYDFTSYFLEHKTLESLCSGNLSKKKHLDLSKCLISLPKNGGLDWNRTSDTRIFNTRGAQMPSVYAGCRSFSCYV